jgi:purine-binding chemotaxis protein CheW
MQTFIVFQLAEQSFAISIDHIREIVLTPEITPLPLAPVYYCGVANVRGKVLAIMDLAIRFGMQGKQDASPERTFTLVVAHPTHAIGFRVEEMPYTLNVADELIENAPNFAQDVLMQYCQALIKHEKELIVLLDLPKLLADS